MRIAAIRQLGPAADGRYLSRLLDREFTDEQLAVITAPLAPQLVVAGAGSGKTTVMAARVVHAVSWHGLPPAAVLGLTFTNKAAAELAMRVRECLRRLRDAHLLDADPMADDLPTVSTYHAYAAGVLADHALRIGREPLSSLLTEAGRWQLAGRVVRRAAGPFADLPWTPATVTRYVLELDSELSEHLVDIAAVRAVDRRVIADIAGLAKPLKAASEVAAAARAREQLLDLVEAYRDRKRAVDAVDFGDQVALAARIAQRCPEVGAQERAEHQLVLLDEYQDTGVAQRVLLSKLYGKDHAVTAVGDPCQSIYGWRGASVGNLLRFFEHFSGESAREPLQLSTNFRSGGRLLDVANAVSTKLRAPKPGARRPHVPVNELLPRPGAETGGETRCAFLPTAGDEAAWVAEEVADAVAAGVSPGEVAVLCRRRSDFPRLHEQLVARGLPVEVVGLGGLLDLPEIADVVATLEVLVEPTANSALVRLLTGPRWAIGPRDLAALGRRARWLATAESDGSRVSADDDPTGEAALAQATAGVDPCDVISLAEAVDSPGDPARYSAAAVARFGQLADEITRLRRVLEQPVVEAVQEVIAAIGLDVEVLSVTVGQATAASANLAAFLDHAAAFTGVEGESDVRGFLDWLAAAREAEDGLDVGGVSAADTVKLLTVHKAKGLEWDVVVVPGLVVGTFPSDRGRSLWTGAARLLPYSLRGDAGDLPADPPEWTTTAMTTFKEACRSDHDEEERRLGYVALTRARRTLILSGYVWSPSRSTPCKVAPYLQETRQRLLADGKDALVWTDPEESAGLTNPLLTAPVDSAWPAALDAGALAARRVAAERVTATLQGADLLRGARLSAVDLAALRQWEREAALLLTELAEERAAVHDVPVPRSLTASQLVRLRADPAGLAADLARPMPRRPSQAARRGTRFHAWVEEMFADRPLIAAEDLAGSAEAKLPEDAELDALRAAFERSSYARQRPHRVEAPFQLVVGSHLVRGRIDAVYALGEGHWDVIDYKTGGRPRDPAAAALQLAVYRLAWAGIAGVPPERVGAGFLYVPTGEVVRPADLPDLAGLARLLDAAGG